MGCRQSLSLGVNRLKGKHYQKTHSRNGVVDTFRHNLFDFLQKFCMDFAILMQCGSKIQIFSGPKNRIAKGFAEIKASTPAKVL